jgi:rSAM/selenodomain-associated transferase 1
MIAMSFRSENRFMLHCAGDLIMAAEKLIVFCKAPRPGLVKTRLAASLGAEQASVIYGQLVRTVLQRVQQVSSVQIRFAPPDAWTEVAGWRLSPTWDLKPQPDGDLGQRMLQAFTAAFESGADRVVLIGTDTPELHESDVREAFTALRRDDVVLGPAADGGYWLIGLSEPHPSLFEGMEWSTDQVFSETVRRAQGRGLTLHLLRVLEDIDTVEDWRNYEARRTVS